MSLLEHKEATVLLEDAEVSAGTVRGCRRRLTGFLERYLPLFYREEQREHAQLVIQGRLSHLERKTCEPIARQAGVQRKPVQQFVGAGKWDDEAVMGEVRLDVAEAFHDPAATLVLDGSGFPKKGTESCGVQRQWCGRLGKVDNCQVGVFLACVSQGRVGPLGRRLYLPREWAESSTRRRKCHVPRGVRFAERWQLGLKLIEQARLTVIRTVESQPKTHYTLSNAAASVPVEEIVWAHDDRHRIEEMFELGNGEVGLDHYEVRSWVGWHHHMTLSLLAG